MVNNSPNSWLGGGIFVSDGTKFLLMGEQVAFGNYSQAWVGTEQCSGLSGGRFTGCSTPGSLYSQSAFSMTTPMWFHFNNTAGTLEGDAGLTGLNGQTMTLDSPLSANTYCGFYLDEIASANNNVAVLSWSYSHAAR
jgi:hypothetical protein